MPLRYRSHRPAVARPITTAQARAIAESVLGGVEWTDDTSGFCKCPGAHHHTTPTKKRDCRVRLDTAQGHVPTIHCFHDKCRVEVDAANFALRSALGRAESGTTPENHPKSRSLEPPLTQLPELPDHGLELLLRTCFDGTDVLSLAPGFVPEGETRAVPEHGGVNLFTRDEWLERIRQRGSIAALFGGTSGLYLRINPVKARSNGADKDVTRFRHTLIESDTLPKDQQERLLRNSGLPIAALIDSGGASIHAWVRVEARTIDEYHQRREQLWAAVPGLQIDSQNKNPSRFSRCPGGRRGEAFQRLLAVNLGPPSFDAWKTGKNQEEQQVDPTEEASREIVAASAFCAEDEPDPPQIIEGILYRGAKMIIAGPSKSRKTWNLTDLAIAVSLGRPWCGFTTRASTVLYVNLEIAKFSYRKRIRMICKGRGVDPSSLNQFHVWNRRGKDNEIAALAILLRGLVSRVGAELLIIDPIYKTYGEREENSNTEMSQVLNELERLAQDTGSAVLIAAHFPKGNLTGRDAIDRVAGASVFGRDPDALLIMTPHEEDDAFTVSPVLRDLPNQPEFVIRWSGAGFERIGADPKAIKGAEREPRRRKGGSRGGSEGGSKPSFLPGSYRAMFAEMPPLRHDRDPEKSDVLAYIAGELDAQGKGDRNPVSVFDSIRQHRRNIIRYCYKTKRWVGVNFQPDATQGGSNED